MKQTQDPVSRILIGTRWSPDTKTSDIHANRRIDHVGNNIPGNDYPGIWAPFTGTVLHVIPDQRRTGRGGFYIEEHQALFRPDGQLLKMGIITNMIKMNTTQLKGLRPFGMLLSIT